MEGPLGIDAWEQIVREGTVTERPGSAGWGEPVGVTEATDVFRTAMGAMETVTLVGSEVIDGQGLHHLRADGHPIGTDAFGIGGSGEASATLDAWVDEEGVPEKMRLETGSLMLELQDPRLGEAAPIQGAL
jgi:hypothetical protein